MTECERIIQSGIISEDFFKEETKCDFHITTERKKIWAISLDLLLQFQKICTKYNIKFFIFYGTLLGAVRHKGFVPWDDDIDVGMLRDDYEELLKHNEDFKKPYFLQTPYTDKGMYYSQAKIRNINTSFISKMFAYENFNQGIALDIFPFDNYEASDGIERFNEIMKLNRENSLFMRLHNPKLDDDSIDRISKLSGESPISNIQKIEKIAQKYNKHETKFVSCAVNTRYDLEHSVFHKEDFNELIQIDFENFKFPAPKGYERILKINYGDYNQFPPEEKRGTWHDNMIIDPDVSCYEKRKQLILLENNQK